jgi:mannosyltransferase
LNHRSLFPPERLRLIKLKDSRYHRPAALLAVLTLAFALRMQQLTYHSIWFDEAMSIHWSRQSIARIWEVSMNLVEDRLPPLYYLFLHGWMSLAGTSEVAVRLPSVMMGVLLVALTYRLARLLDLPGPAGLLGAVLITLNPFLVWYSQEARMYMQGTALMMAGTCLLVALCRHPHGRWNGLLWAGYGLCAIGGLYTHFYAGFYLPAHLFWLIGRKLRDKSFWSAYIITMMAVAAAFLPLALAAWNAGGEAGPGDIFNGFFERLWSLWQALITWKAVLPAWLTVGLPAFMLGCVIFGWLSNVRGKDSSAGWLCFALAAMPLLLATLMLLKNRLAFYGERYFIFILPPALLLAALAAGRLWSWKRGAGLALAAALIAASLIPLPGLWQPSARKEAWRDVTAYLKTYAQKNDVILLHPDWSRYPFQYYYQGAGQTRAVFGQVTEQTPLNETMQAVTDDHPIFWLVETHTELADPQQRVQAWLANKYPLVTELYPPGFVAVKAYAPGFKQKQLPASAQAIEQAFPGGLRLDGYEIPKQVYSCKDDLFHPPSTWVHAAFYWSLAAGTVKDDFTAYAWVTDDLGQVWGDSEALGRPTEAMRFYPSSRWQPGEIIRQDLDVNINPEIKPGTYHLVVGLKDASGKRISLAEGQEQVFISNVEFK